MEQHTSALPQEPFNGSEYDALCASGVRTVLASRNAAVLGDVHIDIQALSGTRAVVYLHMHSGGYTGLEITLHGTTAQVRGLAAQLLRHVEAAELLQQDRA